MIPKCYREDLNNLTRIDVGFCELWFSYQTLVAFQRTRGKRVVCENVWSRTTGKHLNLIATAGVPRLSREEFQAAAEIELSQLLAAGLKENVRVEAKLRRKIRIAACA